MKIYRFDEGVTQLIPAYGSRDLRMARMLRTNGEVSVDVMHIAPGGLVGEHVASHNQLFAVVQGTGWVRSADRVTVPISAGQAAFWTTGEWHESGSDEGMMVIVMEGESVNPEGLMPEADSR